MERLRIKDVMAEKGVTLQQLASLLGVGYNSVWQSVNGNPTFTRLVQIAEALGVRVSDLVSGGEVSEDCQHPSLPVASADKDGCGLIVCPHCGGEVMLKPTVPRPS